MDISASCGCVADLKLGLRFADLEQRLFSLSVSDLGWSIALDPVCFRSRSRFRSVSIDMDGWSSVVCGGVVGGIWFWLDVSTYLDHLKRLLFFSPAIVISIYLQQLIIIITQTEVVLSLVGLGYAGEIDLDLNWRKSNVKGLILIYWHKTLIFKKWKSCP